MMSIRRFSFVITFHGIIKLYWKTRHAMRMAVWRHSFLTWALGGGFTFEEKTMNRIPGGPRGRYGRGRKGRCPVFTYKDVIQRYINNFYY